MITYLTNGIFNIPFSQWDTRNDNDLYVWRGTRFIFLFYIYTWYCIILFLWTVLSSNFVRNDETKMFNQSIKLLTFCTNIVWKKCMYFDSNVAEISTFGHLTISRLGTEQWLRPEHALCHILNHGSHCSASHICVIKSKWVNLSVTLASY